LNIKNWLEKSQNYYKYSPILIESIFHRNIQITKNLFIIIYLGIWAYNKFLTPDLFTRINPNPKPYIDYLLGTHENL
jgi:hypothetical protein